MHVFLCICIHTHNELNYSYPVSSPTAVNLEFFLQISSPFETGGLMSKLRKLSLTHGNKDFIWHFFQRMLMVLHITFNLHSIISFFHYLFYKYIFLLSMYTWHVSNMYILWNIEMSWSTYVLLSILQVFIMKMPKI